jgi:hypothetical protein
VELASLVGEVVPVVPVVAEVVPDVVAAPLVCVMDAPVEVLEAVSDVPGSVGVEGQALSRGAHNGRSSSSGYRLKGRVRCIA